MLGWWIGSRCSAAPLTALGVYDLLQRRHSILRNYPLLGHMRFLLEAMRPELQQYFIERNFDGRPYDRDTRTSIYERAKGIKDEQAFGTERDVDAARLRVAAALDARRSTRPTSRRASGSAARDCTKPYDMALLNVSAMSFGALSGARLRALNRGAAARRLRPRHRRGRPDRATTSSGGDLVWELGSGYFGARTQGRRLRPRRVPRQGRPRARQAACR